MKINERGERLCDQAGCELLATHYYVWTGPQVACVIHAQKAEAIADMMGFPTVSRTMRELTVDEMMPEEES